MKQEKKSGIKNFYPRPPRGGRHSPCSSPAGSEYFYPRPPRGGRPHWWRLPECQNYFYPRPPRGGRPAIAAACKTTDEFLSTPSARRATTGRLKSSAPEIYFYPRPPRGGRLRSRVIVTTSYIFLSTPSARRATRMELEAYGHSKISIHALREEGDSKNRDKISIFKQIIQHSARI